jgi:hypothetical protein
MKNNSDSIQYSTWNQMIRCSQHTYIDTYFHMIKNTANTTDCIKLAVLAIYALFSLSFLLGDCWFPVGAASEAGGGGEIGGTSHAPNVPFG